MNLDDMLIRVHPGDGLVARSPGAALVLFGSGATQSRITDELLRLVEASADGAQPPGRRLARQVARLLADTDPDEVPSFGLLAQAEHGLVLILHGEADADISRAGVEEHLSGRQVATWIDRILEPPVDSLVIGPTGRVLAAPDPRFRLRAGAVPGGGLQLVPVAPAGTADRPEPSVAPAPVERMAEAVPDPPPPPPAAPPSSAPPPAPPAPMMVEEEPEDATKVDVAPPPPPATMDPEPEPALSGSFTSVLLMDAEPEEVREALPVAGDDGAVAVEAEPQGPQVKGVICSRGHFNDPSAPFCAICGISMVQKTLHLVDGPRPPLGVLVLDDGATFSVDNDYVLGREPESDPDVVSGKARPLALTDPDRTVSRVHAALVLEDWNVKVVDRGSANGTYLAPPGQDDWAPLHPNQVTTIKPGTRVRLGQRVLLYDSHGGTR